MNKFTPRVELAREQAIYTVYSEVPDGTRAVDDVREMVLLKVST